MSDILRLARPEIRALVPAAAHSHGDTARIRLHANENPWPDEGDEAPVALNRYCDGQPRALVQALAAHYGCAADGILVTRGSDEAIDLLVRAFCRAGTDRILVCPPCFGMYRFSAEVQGAGVVAVPLAADFQLDADALVRGWTPAVKVVFLCSPNNPTGNALDTAAVERVLAALDGRAIVAIDEAYVEFAQGPGFLDALHRHPGLVILRTLSKAHGLASSRCGVAIAAPELIELLGRIMPPYALPGPTVAAALAALDPQRLARTRGRIRALADERERLRAALAGIDGVLRIWPSEANFLLVEFDDAARALAAATDRGLLLRDFPGQPRLAGCLRITIGSREENDRLLAALGSA
jgi:histidinol-phosphate aminotransferase